MLSIPLEIRCVCVYGFIDACVCCFCILRSSSNCDKEECGPLTRDAAACADPTTVCDFLQLRSFDAGSASWRCWDVGAS